MTHVGLWQNASSGLDKSERFVRLTCVIDTNADTPHILITDQQHDVTVSDCQQQLFQLLKMYFQIKPDMMQPPLQQYKVVLVPAWIN